MAKYSARDTNIGGLILAAGLGTRLRPLTEKLPKPLLPICAIPLVKIIIERLLRFGIHSFAMNTHYQPRLVKDFISENGYEKNVCLFNEKKILGTGGVLANCREFLMQFDHFILHNGDIITDMDIEALLHRHISSGATATMALLDGPENRVLSFGGSIGDICGKLGVEPPSTSKLLTYSGVAAFSKKIFDYVPKKPEYISLVDILIQAIAARPGSVKGFVPKSLYWNDIGTFRKYFEAHEDIILHNKMKIPGIKPKNSRFIGKNSSLCKQSHIGGFLCVGENCEISKTAKLKNCIIFDDTRITNNERHCDEILWHTESYHKDSNILSELKTLSKFKIQNAKVTTLAEQGSARKFYRIKKQNASRVLMLSSPEDKDFSRFLNIGRLLSELKLGSPKIYNYSETEFAILMEDLGDGILHDIVQSKKSFLPIYKKILDWLFKFQITTIKHKQECENAVNRRFDFSGLRWESEYFTENFLEDYLNIDRKKLDRMNPAFDFLAEDALKQPQILIHRDFQSQNIIIKDGQVRIVDFQGARFGPLCYDMMSLVWDPYVPLPPDIRKKLMKYYFAKFADKNLPDELRISHDELAKFAIVAGLQRLMQALGAYCFLSFKKGKKSFLKHIPAGRKNLKLLLEMSQKLDFYNNGLHILKKII